MRHKAWMSTVAYAAGVAGLVALPFQANWTAWLPALVAIQIIGGFTLSVGYHRLFCHQAFKTHPFWHKLFAGLGVFFVYGSPIQWTTTHAAHHKHSDTPLDPHKGGWRSLFSKSYRDVPLELWRARRLLRQDRKLHTLVDKHFVELWAGLAALMALVSPAFVLKGYLPALGIAHFIGALHNFISHHKGAPRDLWFMELIAPAGGEWLHGTHHNFPGRRDFKSRWYHIDPGLRLINLIRR